MAVSHFDFDHVSGIPELTKVLEVGRFIIPLVPEAERLFLLSAAEADGSSGGQPGDLDFYRDLIIDPASALQGLTANQPAPAEVQVVPPSRVPELTSETAEPELLSPKAIVSSEEAGSLTIRYNPTHAEALIPDVVWEWQFFVAKQAKRAIAPFIEALIAKGLIGRRRDLRNRRVLTTLVKEHAKELAQAYNHAVNTVGSSYTRNLTSLMMYSGPPAGSGYRAYRTRSAVVERAEIGAWNPRPAWLGLGDADLRSRRRVSEVGAAFHRHKPYVGTFAPSHHGARPDWHDDLMSGFASNNEYSPTYVFAASGNYRSRNDNAVLHPDGDVILAINESGGTTVIVGLSETSRWTESLNVFVAP